jgi:putative tryptophan/tyrosine transport system substrate-binding protein
MRRREFGVLLGGAAAARPLAVRAQQKAIPVIGFLSLTAAIAWPDLLAAFRQGLAEAGFVEGQNAAIEYRWAENDRERLPAMAVDLVSRQVAVIVATGGPSAIRAAMQATRTIPIVFTSGADPVAQSYVASLSRPGGNTTGATLFTGELIKKRLQLLLELVPKAATVAFLLNPNNPTGEPSTRDAQAVIRSLGLQVQVAPARTERDLDEVFQTLVQQRVDALIVVTDPFFESRRHQLVALAETHAIPAIFQWREDAVAGGLISYGTNIANMYSLAGVYTGKILKGAKPADLPVMQPTIFELVINLKTAKALGLTIPQSVLGRADELIE